MSWLQRNRLPYSKDYRAYLVTSMPGQGRQSINSGGKIILPPSALEHLTRLNTAYPMLFKLTNVGKDRLTHCGVLEFIAEEGRCYIPSWMMNNLLLEEGNIVRIQSVSLPVGKFSKFEPLSSNFLDITNPQAVLESALRGFACLTTGDTIAILYNERVYELNVLETQPGSAISIIECNMDVDFAPPVDYVEAPRKSAAVIEDEDDSAFTPFSGSGNRLDGKRKGEEIVSKPVKQPRCRGIPDYNYEVGSIQFSRHVHSAEGSQNSTSNSEAGSSTTSGETEFKAFKGQGRSLLSAKKEVMPAIPLPPPPDLSVREDPDLAEDMDTDISPDSTVPPPSTMNTPLMDENDLNQYFDYDDDLGLMSSNDAIDEEPFD